MDADEVVGGAWYDMLVRWGLNCVVLESKIGECMRWDILYISKVVV